MVERFFATKKIGGASGGDPTMTLLSGPPSSGKTSLSFQFAINCASESCGSVVFLCNKRRLETKPPFLSQGIDPSSGALQRIQMKYIEDDNGLKKYFAAFHLHENFPAAVIVDDFGDFFSDRWIFLHARKNQYGFTIVCSLFWNCQDRYGSARGKDLAMVRTLALCRDAIAYANKKLHNGSSCKFLVSDTHQGDNPRQLFIYKRWIECIFTIHGVGQGLFYLKTSSTAGNVLERTRTAKYSIALHHLQLEEIVDA